MPSPTLTPTPTPTFAATPTSGSAGADRVIAFNPGPGAEAKYQDADALLGEPDLVENPCCQGMTQLGRGGSVLLAFADNTIVDGTGPDFQVYGESAKDDFLMVEVSADGQVWEAFPKVSEASGGLDLADVGLAQAVYVRLTDVQPATPTGAEVDAAVALHSGPALSRLPDLPDAVARTAVTLYEGPDTRMKEVGRAAAGGALKVLGRSPVSGWAKVQATGSQSGWAPTADLGLNVTLASYALAQAPPTPTPKATATPRTLQAGAAQARSQDGMVMVYVPAGSFKMGSANSDGEAYGDEKPQHTVTLNAFWIDRTEVTNAQYRQCVQAGACAAPSKSSSRTRNSYYGNSSFDNYPVVYVNWSQANAYCRWAGGRLPTEAEWEKAARGADGRKYPWGNGAPDCTKANYDGKSGSGYCVGDTTRVGSYPAGASPYGALDMAGNVQEWLNDWYGQYYYSRSPAANPLGPDSGSMRVLRGGSWLVWERFVRAAGRDVYVPSYAGDLVGFRCARSGSEP
jgi:formylglycine-generating enzyme required for sulfatase activity